MDLTKEEFTEIVDEVLGNAVRQLCAQIGGVIATMGGTNDQLRAQIDGIGDRLCAQVDGMNGRLCAQADGMNGRLCAQADRVIARADGVCAQLDSINRGLLNAAPVNAFPFDRYHPKTYVTASGAHTPTGPIRKVRSITG